MRPKLLKDKWIKCLENNVFMKIFNFLKKKELTEIRLLKDEVEKLKLIIEVNSKEEKEKDELEKKISELNIKYKSALDTYTKLYTEVKLFEEKANLIEYGLYEPKYNFEYSLMYLSEKNSVNIQKTEMVLKEKAIIKHKQFWDTLNENTITKSFSRTEIEIMKMHVSRLMILAFNNGCSLIIKKAKWNNLNQLSKQITSLYNNISGLGLGTLVQITLSKEYEQLQQKELYLEYEYQVKKQKEKEEEKANREALREEEKARKEYEKTQREAELEELNYQKSIEKIKERISNAKGEEYEKLQNQIKELEQKLFDATEKKERAISMAQQTKRGHVYIISNVGAFGEDVYKIGMTRRLEPIDRVHELGNASVPFHFDIHAMIYSEDAPSLESELHKAFTSHKVNMLNHRKEFFKVKIEEIENKIKELGIETIFNKNHDAHQYRETLAIIENLTFTKDTKSVIDSINEIFPRNLTE